MKMNFELVSEILSFGGDIEVIEPLSLREEISRQIAILANKYSPVQKDCTPR